MLMLSYCYRVGCFRNPDFNEMNSLMKNPIIFDGRNLYSIESMKKKFLLLKYWKKVGQ